MEKRAEMSRKSVNFAHVFRMKYILEKGINIKIIRSVNIKGKKMIGAFGVLLASSTCAYAQDSNAGSVPIPMELNLQKAIEIALAENPTIKVADKDIELKKVADTEAWQALLPTLDASLALQNSVKVAAIKTQMGEFKMGMDGSVTATGSATLALPIYAPAVYQNMKLTKEDIKLAQEKSRSSKLDLINQVTKAYYACLLSQDACNVMQKSYNTTKEYYDLVNKKFQVGKVSEYDKISAEVQMRSMNSSVVSAQTGLKLALLRLKVLMGVTEDVNITIADKLDAYKNNLTIPQIGVEEADLQFNSSMRQLNMNMGLLNRARKILKTNFIPTVGLQFQGQYMSYSNENWNIFKYKFSPAMTLAIAVNIPIYHASNFTKLKSNKIQMAQLADTRLNTERQLKMAVESYKQNMASTIAQVTSNEEAVKQANKAVEISSKRYEVGHGTILELNQSETAKTQAELTYVQSIYDYLTNKADLDYTLGRETYLK